MRWIITKENIIINPEFIIYINMEDDDKNGSYLNYYYGYEEDECFYEHFEDKKDCFEKFCLLRKNFLLGV